MADLRARKATGRVNNLDQPGGAGDSLPFANSAIAGTMANGPLWGMIDAPACAIGLMPAATAADKVTVEIQLEQERRGMEPRHPRRQKILLPAGSQRHSASWRPRQHRRRLCCLCKQLWTSSWPRTRLKIRSTPRMIHPTKPPTRRSRQYQRSDVLTNTLHGTVPWCPPALLARAFSIHAPLKTSGH